jgi:hypothetical protein
MQARVSGVFDDDFFWGGRGGMTHRVLEPGENPVTNTH